MGGSNRSTLWRFRGRLTGATGRSWLLVGSLLGVGMLPCPGCGTPMILHFWPLAGAMLAVKALKRRYRGASLGENGARGERDASPVDHRRE